MSRSNSQGWRSKVIDKGLKGQGRLVYLDRERWIWTFCHLPSLFSQTRVSSLWRECGTPLLETTTTTTTTI